MATATSTRSPTAWIRSPCRCRDPAPVADVDRLTTTVTLTCLTCGKPRAVLDRLDLATLAAVPPRAALTSGVVKGSGRRRRTSSGDTPILMSVQPHHRIAQRAMQPRYTFAEAGRLIARQPGTMRRWALGHDRLYRGDLRHDPALIRVDGNPAGDEPPLSFLNLIELRFLASWREHISLPGIRAALGYAAAHLCAERPLLELDFKRRGKELFVEYEQHLVSATREGQVAWPEAADALLDSLDYDEAEHAAYRWWPLGRRRPVLLDTRVNGGRPTTASTGVRTVAIATRIRDGWDLEEITEDTAASQDEIRAAASLEGLKIAA